MRNVSRWPRLLRKLAPSPQHSHRADDCANEQAQASADQNAEQREQMVPDESPGDADQRARDHPPLRPGELPCDPTGSKHAVEDKARGNADEQHDDKADKRVRVHKAGPPGETPHWRFQSILACLLYTSPSPRDGLLSR